MKIGILGDVHGNGSWFTYACDAFSRAGIDTILQVGDFGFWPGKYGENFYIKAMKALLKYDLKLYVVPGNHEDYDQIEKIPVVEDGWLRFRKDRIWVAPRGHRWEWWDRSFVALGGAPSVDRTWRLRSMGVLTEVESMEKLGKKLLPANLRAQKSWWEQEAITREEADLTIAGGYADVMVCHDAPNGIKEIEKQIQHNPHGFKQVDLNYAAEGRELLTEVFFAVAPKVFLHGHYHFLVDEYIDAEPYEPFREETAMQTHVLGLSKDYANHSLGHLDTEDLSAVAWDSFMDFNAYRYGGERAKWIDENNHDKESRTYFA